MDRRHRTSGSPIAGRLPSRRGSRGWPGRSPYGNAIAAVLLSLSCLALLACAAGCGGEAPDTRPMEVRVAEGALQAALAGEKAGFVGFVAPSFLEQARVEMPDTDDETLGGVLIAGFLEDIPFTAIVEAQYSISDSPVDGTTIYIWGRFADADGNEMVIEEADAVRIPLWVEDGRLYLDLLDM